MSWPLGETFMYTALPTDGVNALYRSGAVMPNLATNYAGQSGSVQAGPPPPPPPPTLNFQGIWWGAPAGSESGWGLNIAHQGDTIFASWFTYDPPGKAWWLVMTAHKIGANTYQGQLFETTGPAFDARPVAAGERRSHTGRHWHADVHRRQQRHASITPSTRAAS